MNYKDTYVGRNLNALSQAANALIGGNPDVSISARIGYNGYHNNNVLWMLCQVIVDYTFYPLDGWNHCYNAYKRDIKEEYNSDLFGRVGIVLMSIIMLIACSVLAPIFWSYYYVKKLFK